MHVAAKANKVVAALQIRLPTSVTRVVLEINVGGQRFGEVRIMSVEGARVGQHGLIGFHAWGAIDRRRTRRKTAWIRPVWRQSGRRAGGIAPRSQVGWLPQL